MEESGRFGRGYVIFLLLFISVPIVIRLSNEYGKAKMNSKSYILQI
jgi:hypothetical protein